MKNEKQKSMIAAIVVICMFLLAGYVEAADLSGMSVGSGTYAGTEFSTTIGNDTTLTHSRIGNMTTTIGELNGENYMGTTFHYPGVNIVID